MHKIYSNLKGFLNSKISGFCYGSNGFDGDCRGSGEGDGDGDCFNYGDGWGDGKGNGYGHSDGSRDGDGKIHTETLSLKEADA
jgi:hypothetical protein